MLRLAARTSYLAISLILLTLLLSVVIQEKAGATEGYPSNMVALGDSISVGFDTTGLFVTNPQYSWSTGTNSDVTSHYLRIKDLNGTLTYNNYGIVGAQMADLPSQANRVAPSTDYVTILMGANDVCNATIYTTLVDVSVAYNDVIDNFKSNFQTALTTLNSKAVQHILVASIPNLYHLWNLYVQGPDAYDSAAVNKWNSLNQLWFMPHWLCWSMLQNPTSFAADDVNRRTNLDNLEQQLNAVLKEVCNSASNCRFDNNAIYNNNFMDNDVSTLDYFHPSVAGQAKLAALTWTETRFP
jgi:lysophospholipase L1-like esterase